MGELIFKAKAWKFGDNIDTDQINPGKYMDLPVDEAARHVFEATAPDFVHSFKSGEIIAAGPNFGCGSSRETAPDALKFIGVAAVVAESFGRIFFRNAIAIGLPVLICPGISAKTSEGDELEVDVQGAHVRNISTGAELRGEPLHEMMLDSLKKGGIMKLLSES